jgi:putative flippase GtrA
MKIVPAPDSTAPRTDARIGPLRHYGGFVLAGGLALTTDGSILELLMHFGWNPLVARPISIAVAMVVSWLINRRVTFGVAEPPSLSEFGRFAAVSWTAQAVNYTVFSAIMLAVKSTPALIALVIASLVAMFFSYLGFRHAVFARLRGPKSTRTH